MLRRRAKIVHMNIGLAAYGLPVTCGFARSGERRAPQQIDAFGLARLASEHGLQGIETPLNGMLPAVDISTADRLREELSAAGHTIVIATGVVDATSIQQVIPFAQRVGAKVIRATVSSFLEGARAQLPGGWDAHFADIRQRIVTIRPILEEHDIVLALENHQDATSDDLIALCKAGGDNVGITLDVANPLAVGEEPLTFAQKVGPWIRNVHLKDYRVNMTPSGFRLTRCALGDGIIPFPALLSLFAEVAPNAYLNIELAALYGRHIRLFEDDWWDGYGPRDVRDFVPTLRFVATHAQIADPSWDTPWELQDTDERCQAYEREQLERSVDYLRAIGAVKHG
jgi:sugar phosphate isomerase/epimerase